MADSVVPGHQGFVQRFCDQGCRSQIRHLAADMFQNEPALREKALQSLALLPARHRNAVARVWPCACDIGPLKFGESAGINAKLWFLAALGPRLRSESASD